MLPWSNWVASSALGTKVKPASLHRPFDNPHDAVQESGTYGGTKAKPLAAYRRLLCCLRGFLTPIKDADLQNAIVSRRGSSVVLRLLASQDRCQRGMQGLEEVR